MLLLLGGVLGELGLVLGNLLLLGLGPSLLEGSEVTGSLQSLGGDEPLDSGGLGVGLAGLGGDLSSGGRVSTALGKGEETRGQG